MIYYVTVKIEETIPIDDVSTEAEAIKEALQWFDPTAADPEIVDVWSNSNE